MHALLLVLGASKALAGAGASQVPPPPAVDFTSLPASAAARGAQHADKPHPVLARLLLEPTTLTPGQAARIAVHLQQDKGWHTYWKSPGDIGLPTDIVWKVSEGFSVSPHEYPVPQRFEQQGEVSFGYDGEVLLTSVITVPADAAPGPRVVAAHVSWLVCLTSCIPGEVDLTLPVEVSLAPSAAGPWAPLFDHYAKQLPTLVERVDAFQTAYVLSASAVRPNEPFRAAFVFSPGTGTPSLPPGGAAWPTFTPIAASYDWGVSAVTVSTLPDGRIAAIIDADSYAPEDPTKPGTIGGLVQLQVGDRWVRTEVHGALPWAAEGAVVAATDHPALKIARAAPAERPAIVEASIAPPTPSPEGGATLLANLLLAFVGGLILNVMPCVLPVLTLKLYGLVEQSEITNRERQAAGLAYTAGVVASFWTLAGVVVLLRVVLDLQVDWGFQFQYPPYVAGLTAVVFAFGLSLLGVFEIPALGADRADQAASREGLGGTFLSGVFATLLATPCSAPFLGTAIAYAFGAPTPILVAIFTAVGLGLAAPFLVVAFLPILFRFLPRPGGWMGVFKQALGFSLVATTVWLISVLLAQIGPDRTVWFLAFLVAVGVASWVFGHWGGVAESARRQLVAGAAAGAILLGSGFAFLDLEIDDTPTCDDGALATDLAFDDEIPWQPFTEDRVTALAGKPVFIDFTADWCVTCKVNEATVLETRTVRAAMEKHGIVPLKADWTRRDEVITAWLRRNGRAGVPMYLVLPSDPSKEPVLLPEVITTSMVVEALAQAR